MTLRKFVGLFQFGVLDLVTGAFIAHLLHSVFYGGRAPLWMYAFGAAVAVLPDFDILLALSRKKELDLKHRDTLFHQPLLAAATPGIILAFISPFWALLWLLPLIWHYLHDTVGESMGVQWLYPLSNLKFAVYDVDKKGRRVLFAAHAVDYPGMTLDEALEKKFYRLTLTSIIEAILPLILLMIIALTW